MSLRFLSRRLPTGFTLIELLVVVSILGILAALAVAVTPGIVTRAHRAASLNNLRQIGAGILLYAGEHDNQLPGRTVTGPKWPVSVHEYLNDIKIFASPGDPENFIRRGADPLSDARNETSYILNGYNDLGAYGDETVIVRMNRVEKPSQVILLGTPNPGSSHFYMDMLEGGGNHLNVLNLAAYGDGSNYLFADGSSRFIREDDYEHEMWLIDRDFPVP